MLKLFRFFKLREWFFVLISTGLIVFQVWLDLRIPDYMKTITNILQDKGAVSEILKNGGFMLACAFGSLLSAVVISFIASKVAAIMSYRMREAVYKKVEDFSMEEIKKFSTSSLITRTTNDVAQVQFAMTLMLQLLVKAPVMAIWSICTIAGKSWQWSLATVGAVIILVAILAVVMIFAVPRFKKIQKLTDNLNSVTRENLDGLRVVRAYNAEKYQEAKFEKANKDLTDTHLFTGKVMAIMNPGMTLISNGLNLAIYWIGAFIINNAALGDKTELFSDMLVYSSYAMLIVMSFMMLIMVFMFVPRASVSAKRINEVLDTKPRVVDGEGFLQNSGENAILDESEKAEESLNNGENIENNIGDLINNIENIENISNEISEDLKGVVEFKNVSFKYPDAQEYVVRDVSFTAKSGETVAFIGSTGSGKSTIINLIPRFYDATDGEILIDGINVRDYKQAELHKKIGYVPQRAVLFAGSIKSNIDFGDNSNGNMSDEEIDRALNIAQAKNFVDNLELKYDARVAQGGTNFSGGQKQRMSIARAIARRPEIFIFDDSFSALDYKTDKVLRKKLKEETSESIKFIVAQRIGTIKDADKIIVLESGDVVGMGRHEELMKNCEVYREIALSQLSKEELAQ